MTIPIWLIFLILGIAIFGFGIYWARTRNAWDFSIIYKLPVVIIMELVLFIIYLIINNGI